MTVIKLYDGQFLLPLVNSSFEKFCRGFFYVLETPYEVSAFLRLRENTVHVKLSRLEEFMALGTLDQDQAP